MSDSPEVRAVPASPAVKAPAAEVAPTTPAQAPAAQTRPAHTPLAQTRSSQARSAQARSSPSRSSRARAAHRGLRAGLAVRAWLALAGAVVLLAAGVWLTRTGIVDHTFPPYVAGVDDTVITFYSGPYLAGAIGAGALAGLLIVAAITDFWRRRLIGPELSRSHTDLGH